MLAARPLKPGDMVYKVVDCGDELQICSVQVTAASADQIRLRRPFPFREGVRFNPAALGSIFSTTPEGAIELHRAATERARASAHRAIERAERELAWCDAQRVKRAKGRP